MISRVKYGLKTGIYKMRKFRAYFSNDVNDLIVRKNFMLKIERVLKQYPQLARGMGSGIPVE